MLYGCTVSIANGNPLLMLSTLHAHMFKVSNLPTGMKLNLSFIVHSSTYVYTYVVTHV